MTTFDVSKCPKKSLALKFCHKCNIVTLFQKYIGYEAVERREKNLVGSPDLFTSVDYETRTRRESWNRLALINHF